LLFVIIALTERKWQKSRVGFNFVNKFLKSIYKFLFFVIVV